MVSTNSRHKIHFWTVSPPPFRVCTLFFFFPPAHPEVLHDEMQYVDQLRDSVSLLHDDFARPVGQHLVAVLHACGNSWGEDGHGLAHNGASLHGVGLEQAVKDLAEEGQTPVQNAIS